ncbi:hypothetical protein Glove_212g101 [Diversispora epigaea]|uniref:CCHC-type domain-containing protein n=1 Tax=Diversispora epigaea TaxID=1348612 RepID=A0A397ISB1_9GLOM|nr:hypothetical protein Glove_212g101 [Diversispora epigaea]
MDPAYVEVLETNKVLRDELNSEININILNEKKICKYLYELEQCHKTITFQDTTIITQESENQELKFQVSKLKKCLRIVLEDIKKKESYISYLEQELINFEDEDIQRHLDDVRLYFQNRIQIPFKRRQKHIKYTKWKDREKNSRQIINNLNQQIFALQNNPLPNPNIAAIQEVMKIILTRTTRNINESCHPLGCNAFDAAQRTNVIKRKMAGRFFPVPAQNPYNANANIVTEAEMLNWMQSRYREIMVGSTQAALKALMNEKFSMLDTPDTYEKRIKPFVQGIPFVDLLPYLYNHIPDNLEMRIRITAPANLEAFFTELRNKWLESGGLLEKLVDIAVRLGYSGDLSDPIAIHKFRAYATKKKPTKIIYKCSNCEKLGHRKNNCPSLKDKRSKKVNYTYQSELENSDQENKSIIVLEDSDEEGFEAEESTSNNEPQLCFTQEVFLESLKYMISELIPNCPKEILFEMRTFLNNLIIKMKDQFDLHYEKKYIAKERNKIWENITKKYLTIFQPFIELLNRQSPDSSSHKETNQVSLTLSEAHNYDHVPSSDVTLNHAIKVYQEAQITRNWPNPFEIDFLKIEPNDIATILYKIGELIIAHAILDTSADDSLFTDDIPIHLGIKIDKKNVHKLIGAVRDSQSIGTSYNVPITIDSGENSITVHENMSVIPTKKDRNRKNISIMILGTKWQHCVRWNPIVKGEFTVTNNGKTITIPISTRKEVRNAFNIEKLQELEKRLIKTEEWLDMSLDARKILAEKYSQFSDVTIHVPKIDFGFLKWNPIVKGEFTVTNNGKTITIPISTRKEVRNAFNIEKLQELEKRLIKTEEWLDMSLDARKILAEKYSQFSDVTIHVPKIDFGFLKYFDFLRFMQNPFYIWK